MSIELRVKRSRRAASTAKKVVIVLLVIFLCAAVVGGLTFGSYWYATNKGSSRGQTVDSVASRTLLVSKVSYDGVWAEDPKSIFDVYLPGSDLDSDKEYTSFGVTSKRLNMESVTLSRGFGAISLEDTFTGDFDSDPFAVVPMISNAIVSDIGLVCRGGNPSGAYDISEETLPNGMKAVKLSGDVSMSLAYINSEDDTDVKTRAAEYPMIAYIFLIDNHPCAVWCAWDSVDPATNAEIPTRFEEVVSTVWRPKVTQLLTGSRPYSESASADNYSNFSNIVPSEDDIVSGPVED